MSGDDRRAFLTRRQLLARGACGFGSLPLLEQPTFQRDYGFHQSAIKSARLLAHRSFADIVAACQPGQPDAPRFDRVRTAMADSAYAVRVAKSAVIWAWETSGSAGIRNPNKLQRCFRDIYVGAGHQVFDDRNFIEQAKQMMGLEL